MKRDFVARWLKTYVKDNFSEFFWGWYDFNDVKVMQNVGAIYSIWMKGTQDEILQYEAKYNKSLQDFSGYIPLYWGKDVSPCSRSSVHFDS